MVPIGIIMKQSWVFFKQEVKNINNLRYADDTTLMAESQEKLKSFLMKVKKKRVEKLA